MRNNRAEGKRKTTEGGKETENENETDEDTVRPMCVCVSLCSVCVGDDPTRAQPSYVVTR